MMNYIRIAFIALSALSFYACTQKENAKAPSQDDAVEWADIDSFHLIMSEAFHPYTDSGDLQPVKRLAEEIALKSETWAAAILPAEINQDEMNESLSKLKEDSRYLSELINSGASDEEIGASLRALNDSFHAIMEAWNAKEGVGTSSKSN